MIDIVSNSNDAGLHPVTAIRLAVTRAILEVIVSMNHFSINIPCNHMSILFLQCCQHRNFCPNIKHMAHANTVRVVRIHVIGLNLYGVNLVGCRNQFSELGIYSTPPASFSSLVSANWPDLYNVNVDVRWLACLPILTPSSMASGPVTFRLPNFYGR